MSEFSSQEAAPREARRARRWERGQGLAEYALAISLVAVVVMAVLSVLGNSLYDLYENIVCTIDRGMCPDGCKAETVTLTGNCVGTSFVGTVTSTCDEAEITIEGLTPDPDGDVSIPGVCNGAPSTLSQPLEVWSYHPSDGTYSHGFITP